jgi:hypothetical protein
MAVKNNFKSGYVGAEMQILIFWKKYIVLCLHQYSV